MTRKLIFANVQVVNGVCSDFFFPGDILVQRRVEDDTMHALIDGAQRFPFNTGRDTGLVHAAVVRSYCPLDQDPLIYEVTRKGRLRGGYSLASMPKSSAFILKKKKLYVSIEKDRLQYKVITPSGKIGEGKISAAELKHLAYERPTLEDLTPLLRDILKITSERGHTEIIPNWVCYRWTTDFDESFAQVLKDKKEEEFLETIQPLLSNLPNPLAELTHEQVLGIKRIVQSLVLPTPFDKNLFNDDDRLKRFIKACAIFQLRLNVVRWAKKLIKVRYTKRGAASSSLGQDLRKEYMTEKQLARLQCLMKNPSQVSTFCSGFVAIIWTLPVLEYLDRLPKKPSVNELREFLPLDINLNAVSPSFLETYLHKDHRWKSVISPKEAYKIALLKRIIQTVTTQVDKITPLIQCQFWYEIVNELKSLLSNKDSILVGRQILKEVLHFFGGPKKSSSPPSESQSMLEQIERILQNLPSSQEELSPRVFSANTWEIVMRLLDYGADIETRDKNGNTLLHRAAAEGHSEIVKLLLYRGASIDAQDNNGNTPLHWAAAGGHEETVNQLLSGYSLALMSTNQPILVDKKLKRISEEQGNIPLLIKKDDKFLICGFLNSKWQTTVLKDKKDIAVCQELKFKEKPELVKKITIEKDSGIFNTLNGHTLLSTDIGAQVGVRDDDGNTPLHRAAAEGHTTTVRLLLNYGYGYGCDAHIEARNRMRCTPLHLAAFRGHLETVTLLLNCGANIEDQGKLGLTPLHRAAVKGHREVVHLLLNYGANIEARSENQYKNGHYWYTPLHWAAFHGHLETVSLLLNSGANTEAQDAEEHTPLYAAVKQGHNAIVTLLLDRNRDTPLHIAVQLHSGNLNTVDLLLGSANIDAKNAKGYTLLHIAVQLHGGDLNTIDLLLYRGASIDAQDNNGNTPLHWAATGGHEETVNRLLRRGADTKTRDKQGHTPLHRAAAEGHTRAVDLLLYRGASIDAQDNNGNTPLHWAVAGGHKETVNRLLHRSADTKTRDKQGHTPLDWATTRGHNDIATMLKNAHSEQQEPTITPFWAPLPVNKTNTEQPPTASVTDESSILITERVVPSSNQLALNY